MPPKPPRPATPPRRSRSPSHDRTGAGSDGPASGTCVTCGARLQGPYCHECGEKRREPSDLTLGSFAHYALEAVTNADAKLYRTLRSLYTRPGLLTREFVDGRRQPWIGPLQLFLLVNVVFFLSLQGPLRTDALTTDLAFHVQQPIYGSAALDMLESRVGALPEREAWEPQGRWRGRWSDDQLEYRRHFNDSSPRYANSLVILMVPMLAVLLRLLRRRTLFVTEIVLSLHLMTVLLTVTMLLPVLLYASRLAGPWLGSRDGSDAGVALLVWATMALYTARAVRRVHGDAWPAAALRAAVVPLLMFLVITVYRAILFFVVFQFA